MAAAKEVHGAQRAEGLAMILAIGTANPPNYIDQSTYPEYYFHITNNEHQTKLKDKFKRICEKSTIKKRHMYLTEETLKQNPNICSFTEPSLNARQHILTTEVPKLGKDAAEKAIEEWGQPKSNITHLIFCTTGGIDMPGADYQLMKLLRLRPSVKRHMIYYQGCLAGGAVLRLAKDLAENNCGARVLAVCSEMSVISFHGPNETHQNDLLAQALLGDGAAAVVVGSDPVAGLEQPLFELFWAGQTTILDSETVTGPLGEKGAIFHIPKDLPKVIAENIEASLKEAFDPLGISDWNSIFWIAHPGGPVILDQVEAKLALKPEKLRWSRHVLREYGNMMSACVMFILDEMRKVSAAKGRSSTGEGLDWGVLFGFGPGITIETVVLRSVPINW